MVELGNLETLQSRRDFGTYAKGDRLSGPILVLFSASGCAALIYEVVWLQQLQLVIGSSAVSLGLLLATYIGGLFLGSIAAPQLISASRHPLRVYATIEMGIAICGILILSVLPSVASFYISRAAEGFPNLLLRGMICAVCLLPPTILMGASFPMLCRWIASTNTGVSRMGLLYAANIAGAVFGSLWAGFYLLRVYDLTTATHTAVAINIIVTSAAFGLAGRKSYRASTYGFSKDRGGQTGGSAPIYIAIALSGLSALGAEVVWTRLLSVLFGTTVYTFSIILAAFLFGIGVGSGIGSMLTRWTERPQFMFGICQMVLAASIAWTAWAIAKSLPYWPIDTSLAPSPWFNFQLDVLRALWAMLSATLLWGASFPLALASLAAGAQDPGWLAAKIYGASTFGAIVGALTFSFLVIPRMGIMRSQQILIGIACTAALALLTPQCLRFSGQLYREPAFRWRGVLIFGIPILAALTLITTVSEIPWQLIAYGRRIALMMYSDRKDSNTYPISVLYRGEGLNSSIVITDQSGLRIIYVNGNVEASNAADDMRLERIAGHIPALVHAGARDVFIVGFGAGITAGSFITYPEVKSITIAELESLIPPASARFFRRENEGVLNDPRTRVVYDDGRHYLLTHNESFDVITSDPVHLWVKGTSALYSREYFEIVRHHLRAGGVIAQWLPLYDGDVEAIKSVLATFFEVFPNGTVWSNHIGNSGYDLVLLGQVGPTKINVDELQRRLERPDYSAVIASLRAVGFQSAVDILATYLAQASDLNPWLAGAQINLDRNLRLQYLAGLEMNSRASERIYRSLSGYRRFPEAFFTGSDGYVQLLRALLKPSN